ncbi:MAG: hypothetical protein V4696_10170 [Pseudomonadota bacterium]
MVSAEDFEQWRDNPVTRWVMAACMTAADANRDAWISASWDLGKADQAELDVLRTRADAYRALCDTSYSDWQDINGDTE